MYKYILFDLDGTIINSQLGVTRCVSYALDYFGIKEEPENLKHFIGPPLHFSFENFYGFNSEQSNEAVVKFRERYKTKGIYECELYGGIKECLYSLCKQGLILALVTSKYEPYAIKILENLGIRECFTEVVGSSYGANFSEKSDLITAMTDRLGVTDMSEVVMVGDTKYDILGASSVGASSVAVTYGFGTKEEIFSNNPTHIVNTVGELEALLTKGV